MALNAAAPTSNGSPLDPPASHLGRKDLAQRITEGYSSVASLVYETLRDAVMEGMFAPGEILRQEALAQSLGVSRGPVRAALKNLVDDGLLELEGRRGVVVKTHSEARVAEIYEIRRVLERHALKLSLQRMTPERLDHLRSLYEQAQLASEEQMDLRAPIYAELYDTANNPELAALLDSLGLRVGRYIYAWQQQHSHSRQHAELIDAVFSGDTDLALEIQDRNTMEVRDGIIEIIRQEAMMLGGVPSR